MQISINLLPWRQQQRFQRGREMVGLCLLAITMAVGLGDIGVWLLRTWQQQTRVAINGEQLRQRREEMTRQERDSQRLVQLRLQHSPPNKQLVSLLRRLQSSQPAQVAFNQLEFHGNCQPAVLQIRGESSSASALTQFTRGMGLHELRHHDEKMIFVATVPLNSDRRRI